ncbi:MAG TPA: hypothetical protein VIV40_12965 [Kofleriaceae bacterium]
MRAVIGALAACVLVPALAWADNPPPLTSAPPDDAPPLTSTAQADPPADAPTPAPTEPAPEPPPAVATPVAAPTPDELAAQIDELTQKQRELESAQRKDASTREQVKSLLPLNRFINVFVDVGAFAVGGDGSGIRPDIGHVYYPEYMGKIAGQWVFMGDPLSTAINSLGEPSDTSTSREIENDTINSEGRPSLVVNAIGLTISKYIRIDELHGFSVSAFAMLLPRPDDNILDVQLATISYRPLHDVNLLLEAGKIDSVLGVEYRSQDATKRKGITPSLICRYTCGRPLGVRAHLTQGRLSTSATLTNGNNFQQIFEHDTMLKSNGLPTASGHVQWMLPVGQGLEVGVSGALGPQDGQPDLDIRQWHYGFDARLLDFHTFDVTAEFVQGKQPGKTDSMVDCDAAPCLTYKGAYLLVDRYVTPRFIPYMRLDWRSAVHIKGSEFVYESHTFRTTVGAQFEMTSQILGKLEYTYNRELGGIPQFPDDVITTSIVVKTD